MFGRIRIAHGRNYCFYSTLRVSRLLAGLRLEVFPRLACSRLVVRDAVLRLRPGASKKFCAKWAWFHNHHVHTKRGKFRAKRLGESFYCELRRIVVTPARRSDQSAD